MRYSCSRTNPSRRHRLPLQVRDRIGTAAREWDDVILDVAGARATGQPGRGTGVGQLELALDRG